jgi:hypothetical protein
MTQTLSPEDTGEIRTRPAATDPQAETQNLAAHMKAYLDPPSYRRPDVPAVAWGPTAPPPPPLPPIPQPSPNGPPKPAADLAAAQPLHPLERVIDWEAMPGGQTEPVSLLGALGAPANHRPKQWRDAEPTVWQRVTHRPKHRRESPLWGLAQLTVAVVALTAALWWVIA